MNRLYWTCLQCNHIGTVYPHDAADAFDVLDLINGDHIDANGDSFCDLNLHKLQFGRTQRHERSDREADAMEEAHVS